MLLDSLLFLVCCVQFFDMPQIVPVFVRIFKSILLLCVSVCFISLFILYWRHESVPYWNALYQIHIMLSYCYNSWNMVESSPLTLPLDYDMNWKPLKQEVKPIRWHAVSWSYCLLLLILFLLEWYLLVMLSLPFFSLWFGMYFFVVNSECVSLLVLLRSGSWFHFVFSFCPHSFLSSRNYRLMCCLSLIAIFSNDLRVWLENCCVEMKYFIKSFLFLPSHLLIPFWSNKSRVMELQTVLYLLTLLSLMRTHSKWERFMMLLHWFVNSWKWLQKSSLVSHSDLNFLELSHLSHLLHHSY